MISMEIRGVLFSRRVKSLGRSRLKVVAVLETRFKSFLGLAELPMSRAFYTQVSHSISILKTVRQPACACRRAKRPKCGTIRF